MNALIPKPQAVGQAQPPKGVGKVLAEVEAKLIVPVEAQPWDDEDYPQIRLAASYVHDRYAGSTQRLKEAAWLVEILPSRAELDAYLKVLDAGADEPDKRAERAMIGMLLDAYPNGRPPNLAAYADTVLHDVLSMGFSPTVVAFACRHLRRTSKFLPAVAEVVEACEAERASLHERVKRGMNLITFRREAEALIAGLPPPPTATPTQKPEHSPSQERYIRSNIQ